MQRASLPENESTRLSELRQYQILDTPPEEIFNDVTALASIGKFASPPSTLPA